MAEEKTIKVLPGPIDLAKEAWEIYKKRFWTMVGIGALAILAEFILLVVGGGLGTATYFGLGAKLNTSFFGIASILVLLLVVGSGLISAWATGAVLIAIDKWKSDAHIKDHLRDAKPFVLPFFLTSILSGLIVTGTFFLFILPAILFGIWFSMWKFILVLEGKSGLSALHTSREYVRGRFWQVIGRVIAVHLPIVIIGFLFVRTGRGMESGPIHGIYQIVSLLLIPFYLIYDYVLYTHLKKVAGTISKDVPRNNKLVYLVIPLVGYILVVITGIVAVPVAMKMVSQLSGGIPGNEGSIITGNTVKPSTAIVYGIVQYYGQNKKFPESLNVLKSSKILTSIPDEPTTGLPYRYSVEKNGQDFKLCTPATVKPEKCVSTTSKSFDL